MYCFASDFKPSRFWIVPATFFFCSSSAEICFLFSVILSFEFAIDFLSCSEAYTVSGAISGAVKCMEFIFRIYVEIWFGTKSEVENTNPKAQIGIVSFKVFLIFGLLINLILYSSPNILKIPAKADGIYYNGKSG